MSSILAASFGQQVSSEIVDKSFSESEIVDEAAVEREAKVEALSRLSGSPDSLITEFDQRYREAEGAIRASGVEVSRLNRAGRNRIARLRGTTSVTDPAMADILAAEIAFEDPRKSEEREVMDSLESIKVSTAGDEEFAAWEEEFNEDFDAFHQRAEDQLQEATLMEMALDRGIYRPEGALNSLSDFAQYMIPFYSGSSRGGVVDVEHTPGLSEVIFSGKRLQTEATAFRQLPYEEQIERFDEIISEVSKRGQLFGWKNQALIRENLEAYIFGLTDTDATGISVFDSLDTVPTIAGGAYGVAKGARNLPRMLRAVRARKATAELVAQEFRAAVENSQSPTRLRQEELVDEILPDAVNGTPKSPDEVGSALAAQEIAEVQDNILVKVRETPDLQALPEDELQKVVETTISEFQSNLSKGQKLLDVSVVNATNKSGIVTPVLKATIGTANNGGYKSLASLKKALRKYGIDPDGVRIITKEVETEKVVKSTGSKYKVNPANDLDLETAARYLADDATDIDPGEVLINPSKGDVVSAAAEWGGIKFVATREGNTLWFPARYSHTDVAEDLGLVNYGRGFQKGFDFNNPLDSINGLPGPTDTVKFNLKQADDVGPLSPEAMEAGRRVEAARTRLISEERDLADLVTSQQDNFLRMQVGAKELRGRIDVAKKEVAKAQAEYTEAQAAYSELRTGSNVSIVKKNDNLHYAEIELPIRTEGRFSPLGPKEGGGLIRRLLTSGRHISDLNLMDFATLSDSARNTYIQVFKDYIRPSLARLKKSEKRILRDVAEDMRAERKWLTDAEMTQEFTEAGGDPRRIQRFLDAYQAYRTGSDMDYYVRNAEIFNRAAARGLQTVAIDGDTFSISGTTARLHRDPPAQLSKGRVYDAETGTTVAYDQSAVGASGRYVVSLDQATEVRLVTGERVWVNHIIAEPNTVRARPLARNQLNYLEGGSHVDYDPSIRVWAKQAAVRHQGDNNEQILLNPHTYAGGTRPSELTDYVTRLNKAAHIARRLIEGDITEQGAKRSLTQTLRDGPAGLPTRDEFLKRVENFRNQNFEEPHFDPYQKVEIVGDRELPSAYQGGVANLDELADVSGHQSYLETQGRLYYGRRGNRMTDSQGEELPILDPFKALDKSLSNVAKLGSMAAYKQRMANQFLATWGDELNVAVSSQTDPQLLVRQLYDNMYGDKIWQGMDPKRMNQAKNELAVAGRVLNWQGKMERKFQQGMIDFANAVDSAAQSGGAFGRMINDGLHWTMATDFTYGIRKMAFDAFLGLFNIAQLPLQITTSLAHYSVDAAGAVRAFRTYPVMRAYIGGTGSRESFEKFVRGNRVVLGLDASEVSDFIEMAHTLRNNGFSNITGQVLQGDASLDSTVGIRGNPATRVLDWGRTPFNEAETFNRISAWSVAWNKVSKLGLEGQEKRAKAIGLANDLAFNMTHNVRTAWQQGPASLLSQFWSYPSRWLEIMFNVMPGVKGDKLALSKADQLKLLASQSVLYGASGTFVLSELNAWMKQDKGQSPTFEDNPGLALMDRGIIDGLGYLLTGNETRYAEVGSIARFFPDLLRDVTGNSRYGETAAYEFFGGASVELATRISGDLGGIVHQLYLESVNDPLDALQKTGEFYPFTQEELTQFARNISSINNSMEAYGVLKWGELRSRKGTLLASDLTEGDALMSLFNIPLQEQDMITAQMSYLKNRATNIEDAAKQIMQFRSLAVRAETPEERQKYIRMSSLFMSVYVDPSIRTEVLRKANQYGPEAMLQGTLEQMNKIKTVDAMVEAMESQVETESQESEDQ